jgi:hypothetical protein
MIKRTLFMLLALALPLFLTAQGFTPGWQGSKIIPDEIFLNTGLWTKNQQDLTKGDTSLLTSDTTLQLHWKYGAGLRPKFCQGYIVLANPVDLSAADVIGLDVHGLAGKHWSRNVELKFESGESPNTVQAVYTWENLAHLNRWGERLVILKKQFSNYQSMNWSSIRVISFAVTMNSSDNTDIETDSGVLSFKNLIAQSIGNFTRADAFEPLTDIPDDQLQTIRLHAINALKNRQTSTGLLTTWVQDGSSWLYGQGLALRALCEEGVWNNGVAGDDIALAADNLAHFLSAHQESQGYWPRSWNSLTGNINVRLEGDNTVWMGDFPWIVGSLAYYYRKSGDESVLPAIVKGKNFLYDLIDGSGKVNTKNMVTGQKSEVVNYEGYAATIYSLYELGDTVKAKQVMNYVMNNGWDNTLRLWKEGPSSSRPVLLVNVWLAALARLSGLERESLDALSLAGKLLYTRGPGDPYGFDGIGPIATWFEGTLSYITANGPAGNALFTGIMRHINADGTVPAYNENLGALAGIWAVDWPSLDATSWLYFAAAGKTPFIYSGADAAVFTGNKAISRDRKPVTMYVVQEKLIIENTPAGESGTLNIINVYGQPAGNIIWEAGQHEMDLHKITGGKGLPPGMYVGVLHFRSGTWAGKFINP